MLNGHTSQFGPAAIVNQPILPPAGYSMTVEISSRPPHQTPNPAALTCQAAMAGPHSDGLSMQMMWSKDGVFLQSTPQHAISEPTLERETLYPNTTQVMLFESTLTMRALKPSDNGTYSCSAVVVSSSTGQLLSSPVTSSVDMHLSGE